MLLNGAAQTEETALPVFHFALFHSVTCVQLRLITILGNCGCVAVASILGVPTLCDKVTDSDTFVANTCPTWSREMD
jgi:hypothetical protein